MPQISENRCPAARTFTRPSGGPSTAGKPASRPVAARCALTAGHGGLHLCVSPLTDNPVQFSDQTASETAAITALREYLEESA
jgi:hypothetical protein